MRRSVLARAAVCVALTAGAAGCTTTAGSTVTASGKTLTIYVSAPPGGQGGQSTQDVIDAERLALQQAGAKAGSYALRLALLDAQKLSDGARTAISDTSAIAYLGEIIPGASADSLGITNARDLLQVSPTDTAVALTEPTTAVANSPNVYYESLKTYGRTFARVVPNTSLEAKALVSEMQARGVRSLYVTGDGSDYANALTAAVADDARAASITVQHAQNGADGVFYAGSSQDAATRLFDGVAASAPATKLFAPSALADQSFAAALSSGAARQLEVSSPGFLASDLPAGAATQFVRPFEASFGHAPATQAIFGYEAMSALLSVLREAGSSASDRSTVVHDFFAIKNRPSVLGTYSIDAAGDTSLGAFVISRISRGRLVPFKSLQETG